MKKHAIQFFIIIFTMCVVNGYSQSNLLNAKTPAEIGKKTKDQLANDADKPLDYGYVDDRDVLWSKVIWEYVDLNERLNLPYFYPVDTTDAPASRRSLFDTLLKGIKNGKITEVYDNSYFTSRLSKAEVMSKLQKVDTTEAGIDEYNSGNNNIEEYINKISISARNIEGFKIKGIWYFDKRQGELKYRMLALAPIAPDVQLLGRDDIDVSEQLALFWVWFPNARQSLHDMKVFNEKNSAFPLSFDHLLNARRFTSIIYREENIYGDRDIQDYIKDYSLYQVMESYKIKEDIRNKELDMWSY